MIKSNEATFGKKQGSSNVGSHDGFSNYDFGIFRTFNGCIRILLRYMAIAFIQVVSVMEQIPKLWLIGLPFH